MMAREALGAREIDVLFTVVKQFVSTGEPVGSRTITRLLDSSVSAATIRLAMADLEERGYLVQPHTSAGRIPTDQAYRYFVNHTDGYQALSINEKRKVRDYIRHYMENVDQMLVKASELLSLMSTYTGLVLLPSLETWLLGRFELVNIGSTKILVVIVSKTGLITNKVIKLDEYIDQEELNRLSVYINEKFANMNLLSIRKQLLSLMSEEKLQYDKILEKVVKIGNIALDTDQKGELYIGGVSNLLSQPEFQVRERLQEIYQAFTEKSILVEILSNCLLQEDPVIFIGREKPKFEELSLITAKYYYKNQIMGTLGVIGPTRMPYHKIISLVDFTAKTLSRALSCEDVTNLMGS